MLCSLLCCNILLITENTVRRGYLLQTEHGNVCSNCVTQLGFAVCMCLHGCLRRWGLKIKGWFPLKRTNFYPCGLNGGSTSQIFGFVLIPFVCVRDCITRLGGVLFYRRVSMLTIDTTVRTVRLTKVRSVVEIMADKFCALIGLCRLLLVLLVVCQPAGSRAKG